MYKSYTNSLGSVHLNNNTPATYAGKFHSIIRRDSDSQCGETCSKTAATTKAEICTLKSIKIKGFVELFLTQ